MPFPALCLLGYFNERYYQKLESERKKEAIFLFCFSFPFSLFLSLFISSFPFFPPFSFFDSWLGRKGLVVKLSHGCSGSLGSSVLQTLALTVAMRIPEADTALVCSDSHSFSTHVLWLQ